MQEPRCGVRNSLQRCRKQGGGHAVDGKGAGCGAGVKGAKGGALLQSGSHFVIAADFGCVTLR